MKTTAVYSLLFLCICTACDQRPGAEEENTDRERVFTRSIQAAQVQTVSTNIEMKVGKLIVSGGATELMEADIHYSQEDWKPEIHFNQQGSSGQLSVEQPELRVNLNLNMDEDMNLWEIKLNDRVAQDLYCEMGAGESELDLQGMTFSRVRIDAGVGEHNINLRDTSVPSLEINAGVGQVSVDLTGEWHNNLEADINGGIGQLYLRLPADAGIRMQVNGGLGEVDAPGLRRDGRIYTNELYGKAPHTLELDIKAGLGAIEVVLE